MPTPDEIAQGGSSGGGGSLFGSGFLWKPSADHNPNLVVLTPKGYSDADIEGVYVNGEKLRYTGLANGNRGHWRGNKPGAAYGNASIEIRMKDGTVHKQQLGGSGALRYENGTSNGSIPTGGAGGAAGLAGGGAGLVNAEPGPNQLFMQDLFRSVFQPYDPSGGVGGQAAGPKSFTFQDLADAVLGVDSGYDTTAGWLRGLEPGKEFSSVDELKGALPGLDTSNIPARYRADAQGIIDQAIGNLASGKVAGGAGLPQDNIVTSALQNLIAGNLSPSPYDPMGNVLQGAFMKSLGTSGPGRDTIGPAASLAFANMAAGPMGTSRAVPGSPFAGLGALAGLQGGGSAMPTNPFNPFQLPGMSQQSPIGLPFGGGSMTGGITPMPWQGAQGSQQPQSPVGVKPQAPAGFDPLAAFGIGTQAGQRQGDWTWSPIAPNTAFGMHSPQVDYGWQFNPMPAGGFPASPGAVPFGGQQMQQPQTQSVRNLGGPVAGYDPSSFFQPVPQSQPVQPGQERGFGSLLLGPNQGKFMTNPNVNTPQGMSRLWDPGNLSQTQSSFLQQNGLGSLFPGGGGMPGGGGGGMGGFPGGGGGAGGGGGFGGSGGFGGFFGPTNNVDPGILPSYVQGNVPPAIQQAFDTNLARQLANITEGFGTAGARFGTDLADQLGTTAGNANVQLMADAAQRATDAYNALTQNALGFGNLGLGFQNSAINRELGLGQLDLNRFLGTGRLGNEARGLDIQQQLGLGGLAMDQSRLQSQTQLGALNQLLGLGGQLSQQDFLGGQGSLDRALQEYLGQIQRPDPLLGFLGGMGFGF